MPHKKANPMPPDRFWFDTAPDFADKVIWISVSKEKNIFEMTALFKYHDRWYFHKESYCKFLGGGDGSHNDTILPKATDKNINTYVKKFKS